MKSHYEIIMGAVDVCPCRIEALFCEFMGLSIELDAEADFWFEDCGKWVKASTLEIDHYIKFLKGLNHDRRHATEDDQSLP